MQDQLCECHKENREVIPDDRNAEEDLREVIDLTGGTDHEAFAEEGAEGLPIREGRLVEIEEGHSVSGQRCVRSLGPFSRPAPYWIATGLRRRTNNLPGQLHPGVFAKRRRGGARRFAQPSEFGSCSESS
jgi:hypothetical protein